MNHTKYQTIFYALSFTLLAILIILFPKASLEASRNGLNMWWKVVFPSLLPFFIVSELLMSYGVVRIIGSLLEPIMRPVFRVPGVGGFVWVMGMASGFPAGAKLTARLRQENQITAIEGERLVSFTNSSNPLFIFAAISVGFFHDEKIGILLAASHYLSNICVGIIMRFYKCDDESSSKQHKSTFSSIKQAFQFSPYPMIDEQKLFGKVLGDAVINSIQTLLKIGGFIILFSVIIQMLSIIHATDLLGRFVSHVFISLHLPEALGIPFISGLFEITIGSQLTSHAESSLLHKVMIVSFILAFSGFSVQAQVASILAETDIRFKPFFYARIIQGIISAFFTFMLFKPLYLEANKSTKEVLPAFIFQEFSNQGVIWWNVLLKTGPIITLIALMIYIYLYFQRTIWKH